MGNHSSGPTREDYSAYVDDLKELQNFLNEKFVAGHLRSSVADSEFDAEYLEALKIKLRQLQNVRRHVRSRRGRRATVVSPTLMRLLEALEPQCQRAVDELTRLQALHRLSTSTTPSQVEPADAAVETDKELPVVDQVTTSSTSAADVPVSEEELIGDLTTSATSTAASGDTANEEEEVETSDDDSSVGSPSPVGEREEYNSVEEWAASILAESGSLTDCTRWTIDRKADDFLESVFVQYEKARERVLTRPLKIKFEKEEGVDAGGLTKEFFSLAFGSVVSSTYKDCQMFEGERGHLIPSSTSEHLVNGYKYIGMMIVHAVKNGCRGLPGLSPAIQHYIVQGEGPSAIEDVAHLATIDDVADTALRNLLVKLNDGDSLTDADNELLMSWMERCNCRVMLKDNTRQLISQTILIYYVFNSRIVQIEAIGKGMDMFEFRGFLRQNPSYDNLAFVFPPEEDIDVTPEMVTAVSVVAMSDSTDVFHEETFDFFQLFLHELHDGKIANKTLSDLLQFITGEPYLPARLSLTFDEEIVYPVAHACFSNLDLPTTHQHYSDFRDAISFALDHGTAFTTE